MAEKLREAFTAKGYNYLAPNRTNQIFVIVPDAHLAKISEQFEYSYDQRIDATHSCVRFCTSWATKEENVDALIRCVENYNMFGRFRKPGKVCGILKISNQ